MPDQDTNSEVQNGQVEQQQGDPAEQLGDAGKKALAAERKRADDAEKAQKALQAQLDQLSDSKLTETQRLQQQLDDLTAAHAQAQLDAARSRVIAAEGIPASLAGFVTGEDEASMVASAQSLKAAVAEASKPGTPAPDPSQGAHGASPASSAADAFANYVSERLS